MSTPPAPWYTFDVYVSYFQGPTSNTYYGGVAGDAALKWTRGAITAVEQLLGQCGFPITIHQPRRDDGTPGPLDPGDHEAVSNSALMLVLISPEYCESPRCCEELEAFLNAGEPGDRSPLRLLMCSVVPVPGALVEKLPVSARGGAGTRALYDSFIRLPIETNRDAALLSLANDIASRLRQLQAALVAVDKVAPPRSPPPEPGTFEQIYLASCSDPDTWDRVRGDLEQVYIVNPDEMERPDADNTFSVAQQQRRRRLMLLNCSGLVLLRASSDEDLWMIGSNAIADIKAMNDGQKRLPCLLVDSVGQPEPDWPGRFRPEAIHITQADLAREVQRKLRDAAGGR